MVGLKATLVDGSYHPVDSSEMAFKTAASLAYKAGLPMAGPVLLEPKDVLLEHQALAVAGLELDPDVAELAVAAGLLFVSLRRPPSPSPTSPWPSS